MVFILVHFILYGDLFIVNIYSIETFSKKEEEEIQLKLHNWLI